MEDKNIFKKNVSRKKFSTSCLLQPKIKLLLTLFMAIIILKFNIIMITVCIRIRVLIFFKQIILKDLVLIYYIIESLRKWNNKIISKIHIHIAKICNNSELCLKVVCEIYLPEKPIFIIKSKINDRIFFLIPATPSFKKKRVFFNFSVIYKEIHI